MRTLPSDGPRRAAGQGPQEQSHQSLLNQIPIRSRSCTAASAAAAAVRLPFVYHPAAAVNAAAAVTAAVTLGAAPAHGLSDLQDVRRPLPTDITGEFVLLAGNLQRALPPLLFFDLSCLAASFGPTSVSAGDFLLRWR